MLRFPINSRNFHDSGPTGFLHRRCGQVVLTDQLEAKILSLYSRGCSYSDISQHLHEMYGYTLSDSVIGLILSGKSKS